MTHGERARRRRAIVERVRNGATIEDTAIAFGVSVWLARRACNEAGVDPSHHLRGDAYRAILAKIANGLTDDPQAEARKVLGMA